MEYVKFEKVGLSNHVSFSHSNILQRVYQWGFFRMKKHLGVILVGILFHVCKSGQFYPNPTQVILLQSTSMDVRGWLQYGRSWSIHMIFNRKTSPIFYSTQWGVSPIWNILMDKGSCSNIKRRSEQLIIHFIIYKLLVWRMWWRSYLYRLAKALDWWGVLVLPITLVVSLDYNSCWLYEPCMHCWVGLSIRRYRQIVHHSCELVS